MELDQTVSLDYLVGLNEQGRRHLQAQSLRRLEIEDQFVSRRLLDPAVPPGSRRAGCG